MCFSQPKNKAADEANRIEQERQAKISATQATINDVFNDPRRAAEIEGVVGAVRQQQLDQKADRAGVPVQRLHRVTHGSGSVGAHRLADMPLFRQDPPGPRRFDPPAWQKWAGR